MIRLSSASKVWIWNDGVCKDGIAEWMNQIHESEMFLDPSASWNVLQSQAEHLGIKEITLYELYCSYIFPNFCIMNFEVRIKHIKFIAKRIFDICELSSKNEHSSSYSQANMFIQKFKSLKCIGTGNSNLQTIDSFYDHSYEMFTIFCDDKCFLPKVLHDDDIQNCLRYFGLKTVPSTEDFVRFSYQLEEIQDIEAARKASSTLLRCLFNNAENYEHLHTKSFLQQVSNIPIAVVTAVPMLNAIKLQQLGECSIVGEKETITLTKLSGSSLDKNKYSLWTCKTLVKLPTIHAFLSATEKERMNILSVTIDPTTCDIVQNLKNLAQTEFSDASRFHKLMPPKIAKISSTLPSIVVKMIECISENLKKQKKQPGSSTYDLRQLKSDVNDLKFLPVKLEVAGYVLVKPTQVLVMDDSKLSPFCPFLHPLIVEAHAVLHLLREIGVEMCFSYSHMQLVLNQAKELCKDNKVDHNTKRAVVHATVELTMLLRNDQNSKEASLQQPLYLLNDRDVLTDCSKLVVFDSVHRPVLPPEFTYMNLLQTIDAAKLWNSNELLELLPKKLGLKSLKSILKYKMTTDATEVEPAHSLVVIIEQILRSEGFKTAIERYACCCTKKREPPENVTKTMANFQSKLTVRYVKEVQLSLHLNIDDQTIPLYQTVSEDFFLESCGDEYTLFLRDIDSYALHTFLKMSGNLCVALELNGANFEVSQYSGIPHITSFVNMILNCGSVSKIADIIRGSLPGIDNIEQDIVDSEPILGEAIPECWHHTLDQNIFNFFRPQEFVGYEKETDEIIYAQVLYCNNTEAYSSEENMEKIFELKYTITIGKGTKLEVTVLQLYKFVSAAKDSIAQDSGSGELKLHEAGNYESEKQARQARVVGGKQAIRDAVKAAWSLPEEQKRKAIKRLFLQYHPDKNPDNQNATAEFQFLMQEINRMEKGIAEEPLDAEPTFRPPDSFNFKWSGWFDQWNRTASLHRNYRSRNRNRGRSSRGRGSSGWHIPKPQTNQSEASRWFKQAEYDYASLCALMSSSQTDEKTCASTCFMCHEVVEKSLKAGMYAKCGIEGDSTLKSHNIETPARALIQMGCEIDVNDVIFLEDFYYNPRFPYCYPPPTVPGEKFVSSTAIAAFDAATRIYEAMKQLIDD